MNVSHRMSIKISLNNEMKIILPLDQIWKNNQFQQDTVAIYIEECPLVVILRDYFTKFIQL